MKQNSWIKFPENGFHVWQKLEKMSFSLENGISVNNIEFHINSKFSARKVLKDKKTAANKKKCKSKSKNQIKRTF